MTLRLYFFLLVFSFAGSLWGQENRADSLTKIKEAEELEQFADSCFGAGNISFAIEMLSRSAEIRKKYQGYDSDDYATQLLLISFCYSKLDNYAEAIRLGTEAMEIRKKVLGTKHMSYLKSLIILASYNSALSNYPEAIRLETEVKGIQMELLGTNHPDYTATLDRLIFYNSQLHNFAEAIRLSKEVIEIRKVTLGTETSDYATSLHDLAFYNAQIGNYTEAIKLGTEAKEIIERIQGTDNSNYVSSLINLAYYNSETDNYTEAIRLWKETKEIQKILFGTEHLDYATCLDNLASCYSALGDDTVAIRLGTESVEIRRRISEIDHPDYVSSLSNLAYYYSKHYNYTEAIKIETMVKDIKKRILGTEHLEYAKSLSKLAYYNSEIGNFPEAIQLETEITEIRKKTLGTNNLSFAASLIDLANYNSELGNYTESIRFGKEAAEIRKRILGTEHPDYAASLSNLAFYIDKHGDYPEAIKLGIEATEIYRKALGAEHPSYVASLHNLAGYFFDIGETTEAIRIGTEALEVFRESLDTESPNYAKSLNSLACWYSALDINTEAIKFGTEATDIYRKTLGTMHQDYARSLHNLSSFYFNIKDYEKAISIILPVVDIVSNNVIKTCSNISSTRRLLYWNIEKDLFLSYFPLLVYTKPTSNLISLLYDKSALLTKGFLLNTEIEMTKLIIESGDTSLIKNFQDLLSNKEIYNKLVCIPISKRGIETDSLKRMILNQEDELIRKSKIYGDYMHNLRLTWKDIQSSLDNYDIAIEFLSFPVNKDSVMYVALTLRKESEFPKMIILFEEKQQKEVSDTMYYQCEEMTDLVWKPLESELKGIKNIYFSPSGTLYNIGIEYLPGMENYNIYRLSSTRELVTKKKTDKSNHAVLYGGLDYYASLNESQDSPAGDDTYVERANVRGMGLRGGKEPLPQSKVEVEKIGEELNEKQWVYNLLTGADGTEESFKSLSGKKTNCLHVSTHGFYYISEKAEETGYNFLRLNNEMASAEDKSLTRSGLIMSGANHILEGESLPDNVEDGILTAKEIADVDLRGLDLVVLSACQTGLGDISQGEGVLGLQRGFKKAGASTILMSLWEVNDEASQILMTQFYRNMLNGQGKHQALLSAQKYLREIDDGKFDEPKYWAAFILLDAKE